MCLDLYQSERLLQGGVLLHRLLLHQWHVLLQRWPEPDKLRRRHLPAAVQRPEQLRRMRQRLPAGHRLSVLRKPEYPVLLSTCCRTTGRLPALVRLHGEPVLLLGRMHLR